MGVEAILWPVYDTYDAGDTDRAEELLGDIEARASLGQALSGWEWGDIGGDGHE